MLYEVDSFGFVPGFISKGIRLMSEEDMKADKGLVDVSEEMPKIAVPRRFESYLSRAINEKQKEISNLIESGNSIRDTIYCLKPVAVKFRNKYRVFEPKYRRRT